MIISRLCWSRTTPLTRRWVHVTDSGFISKLCSTNNSKVWANIDSASEAFGHGLRPLHQNKAALIWSQRSVLVISNPTHTNLSISNEYLNVTFGVGFTQLTIGATRNDSQQRGWLPEICQGTPSVPEWFILGYFESFVGDLSRRVDTTSAVFPTRNPPMIDYREVTARKKAIKAPSRFIIRRNSSAVALYVSPLISGRARDNTLRIHRKKIETWLDEGIKRHQILAFKVGVAIGDKEILFKFM